MSEKLEQIISKISKKSLTDYKTNVVSLLDDFEESKIQNYFFKVVQDGEYKKDPLKSYNELCLAEYLCELIIIVYSSLYDDNNCTFLNQEDLLNHFHSFFGEEKK